jgi:hypothetical protein
MWRESGPNPPGSTRLATTRLPAVGELPGRIRYYLRFIGRPDLDSRDFRSLEPYQRGDALEGFREGLRLRQEVWQVKEVAPGRSGEPETLICEIAFRG